MMTCLLAPQGGVEHQRQHVTLDRGRAKATWRNYRIKNGWGGRHRHERWGFTGMRMKSITASVNRWTADHLDSQGEHADLIGPLLARAVIPVLDGGEAEADGLAGGGMLPCAPGQPLDRGLQLAFGGRRCQQLSDDGEAQVRPPLVNAGTSC